MLARVLAVALDLSLCLCLSVISRCSVDSGGRIELVFGIEASFDLFCAVLQLVRNTNIRALPSGTLS